MPSIVKQFRALKETRLIFDTYRFNGQKLAASVFNYCIVCSDDEKLLKMLRKHIFTLANSLQSFPPEILPEWREFLIELINDVIEAETAIFDIGGVPSWADESRQLVMHTRLGKRTSFYVLRRLIMDGIDRLPIVASFASDCKNIVAVGKTLPNITRDIVESGKITGNVIHWFNLVEIYTRKYQGRDLYKHPKYAQLVNHLAKYENVKRDILIVEKLPMDKSNHEQYVSYFLKRVQNKDLHLSATFLCDNFNAIYEFCRSHDLDLISTYLRQALGLAAMTLKEEREMSSKIQQTKAKPVVSADLGRKLGDLLKEPPEKLDRMTERVIEKDIDELIANLKQAREQLAQMRDAATKLRATIAKSKKLIADWEC
ncbi:MAG: hypothetical protein HXP18_01640 [Veillonella sp.]|nr:hypothetical protein [Veillonella sp.]